ncbi:hypothetical protein PC129_g18555 [Phytophthora cactorum]|uniref:Uncharacterized protein n=1 Tax=Phytophthora cactorum TaxID=29920 RepID=A0A329S3J0_9STRA|nr:DNA repair protein XRCC4, C-terminal [Phytophthora cactorum]KAG2783136.1 hypothetical protein Pcac1_g7188 [Phytophthora cactorum]KAG2804935.1 hypothetical protein PC111_g18047 [Phytophthora cactorum]KAG2812664.1 hypothetical protein PC112_g15073 [Phytophthora cactorum]KAG2852210.1 hypothetical protein PC113_g15230 [Phytophthora cactorum]
MSLAEVGVVDSDASTPSSMSLFMHCSRLAASSSSPAAIRVQLLDPPALYAAEVSSRHKPRALDCSGVEYVAVVEKALSPMTDTKSRFEFRWSRQKRTLTFMERSEFAMKFCAIDFQVTESGDKWRMLLHQVAAQQKKERKLIDDKCSRVTQLEMLLEQKEKLLETALVAKQSTEDCLIQGFCAVLNAKKDEIKRLQDEVEMVQRYEAKPVAKTKPMLKRARKATGAKLKRKKKEEDSDESSNDENDESMGTEEKEGELKRAKREAVNAYRELPENLKHSSVRISSAEDLLSSMDDIIKNEAEVDEATQRGDMTQMKSEPVLASQESKMESKSRLGKVTPMTTEPAAPPEPVKPTRSAPPPVDKSLDSEEEDILDMLS